MNTKRHHAKRGQFSSAMQQPLRRVLNLAILTIIYPAQLLANPNGADVINGQVTIDTSAPGVMTITNSPNAIIHWQDFNVAKSEILQFIQANGQSAVLNRVVGGNPSEILGQLISNGKVFLINPSGIVFGPDAVVNTQGLLASSLNLSDDDFLHGNYHFIAEGKPGSIVNQGIIRVGKEGNIMLIAPTINNSGTISSEGGQITLAAGRKMLVTNLDDPDISFEIQAPKDAVLNLGKILTEGGVISAFAGTITHSGEMNADSASIDAQGNIVLSASKAVTLSEDSQLSVNNSQGDAGSISIESQQGSVTIAGDISAKASSENGNGGVIKTSGHKVNTTDAKIDASAQLGHNGQWHVDADNIRVQTKNTTSTTSDDSVVTTESVRYALEHSTDVSISAETTKTGSANGNLQVASDLIKRSGGDAHLTLSADNDITVDSAIRASSGRLAVTVKADNDENGAGSTVVNKALDLNAGQLTVKGAAKFTKSSAVRRANIVIDAAEVDVAGALSDIDLITVNSDSALTLSRDYASFKGGIENSGLLTVNRLLQINSLTLNGGTLAGEGKVRVTQAFNFAQGQVVGDGDLITANTATSLLATKGAAYLDKHWFNYGTANWTGANAIASKTGNGQWTNGVRSVLNLGDATTNPDLALNLAQFNNAGVVNVLGGHLKISASGNDDGRYEVADQAFLSFLGGQRTLRARSVINSEQVLSFANGQTLFQRGSKLNVDELDISSFALLTLRTGRLLSLNSLTMNTGALSGNDSIAVSDQFSFHAGTFKTYGLLTTAANATTTLADVGNVSLGSRWDNYGVINWDGSHVIIDDEKTAKLTNKSSGVINIGNDDLTSADNLELNTRQFNNEGVVNLAGGALTIVSSGTDTGSYDVADNGLLAFWYGNRTFANGAVIDSPSTVTFKYGKNYFNTGSMLNADSIAITDQAKVVFRTGNTQSFTDVTINRGLLHGSDDVTISRMFTLHAGTLSGIGKLTTAASTTTTLADEDTVYLDKYWDNQGIINWNGQAALRNSSNYSHFTNLAGGVFNVGVTSGLTDLAINVGQFNNQGTVNLVGGVLKIYSFGTDTGNYLVSNKGFLQFWNGTRNFESGSVITSNNLVTFSGGINRFNQGASLAVENILIDSATVNFKTGVTVHIPELTLVNAANLTGTDALSVTKSLAFHSGALGGGGLLTTGKDASVLLSEGISLLNRDWDNYGVVQFINTDDSSDTSRTEAATLDADFPVRYWNNYGTINWLTNQSASSDLGQNVVLTNKTTGIFNIGLSDAENIRELNLGAFNNQGTVNVASGVLRIFSPGKDTGAYVVSSNASLQFYEGKRLFNGVTIDSVNPVSLVNSDVTVRHNATSNAPSWIIDGSIVRIFDNLTLADVQFSSGTINNFGNLRLTGGLNWSGGALGGPGNYQFTNGFAYTGGTVSAIGSLTIKDDSGLLTLPAMSSIKRLTAESSGDLRLNGDISANAKGNAIVLKTAGQFDNAAGARLTANNGRWLIFSANPSSNQLGGLNANFKHYGCTGFICNNGFDVNDQAGNGLLYAVTPVLTVTPNAVTSHYRDPVTFTSNYTGFIDGDDANTAGISGTPVFTDDATFTADPNYADEGSWDVNYASGLVSQLGYEFEDNSSSAQEWTVLPPQVRPIPVETIQEGIKDQQNQVLVITKPDTLLMDIADSPKTDDDKNNKPLKQCR